MRFIVVACILVLFVAGAIIGRSQLVPLLWMFGVGESIYYGWHTDILRAGERVVLTEDFAPPGHVPVTKGTRGIVKADPAWDEDSCEPERPVSIQLFSADTIAVPRHALRR